MQAMIERAGLQYMPTATAGDLILYHAVSFSGRVHGTSFWMIVDTRDDRERTFADRPNIATLRRSEYRFTDGQPNTWRKLNA